MRDVLIIGGGPAGLTAALWLGRCRRRVLLCDARIPRNGASRAVHGFLGHDGVSPRALRRIGRAEVARYGVEVRHVAVEEVEELHPGYLARLADGTEVRARKLLLATGMMDALPSVRGTRALYGRSVFHCPYCDAWEFRDQPLAVYARGQDGLEYALLVRTWSRDLVLFTDGPHGLSQSALGRARRLGLQIRTEPVVRLLARGEQLEAVLLHTGEAVPRRALFFKVGRAQRSHLPETLGCHLQAGAVEVNRLQGAVADGIYAAGDAVRDVHFAIVAAAEGARAAYAIHAALLREDLAHELGEPALPPLIHLHPPS